MVAERTAPEAAAAGSKGTAQATRRYLALKHKVTLLVPAPLLAQHFSGKTQGIRLRTMPPAKASSSALHKVRLSAAGAEICAVVLTELGPAAPAPSSTA